MELIATADAVDKMDGTSGFLIQCPKTELVYIMYKHVTMRGDKLYYGAKQQSDTRFLVDTNYVRLGADDERYYFSTERLKEMITSKSFAIER